MSKIIFYDSLSQYSKNLLSSQRPLILVTGVFDLLHQAHQEFLQKAKAAGKTLFVGVESDKRVKELKGNERPIYLLKKRLKIISQLDCVDFAFGLPENFNNPTAYRELLSTLKPDILAVSSHSPYLDIKKKMMVEVGGDISIVMEHNPAISTTILLEKSKKT